MLTGIDTAIAVVVLLSALMALLRGFVRETLTIFAWVSAVIVAIASFRYLSGSFREYLTSPEMADAASFLFVFVVALIPAMFLTNIISRRFGRDDPGPIDRVAGFAFGTFRGLFLWALVYWGTLQIAEPGTEPELFRDATFLPVIKGVAGIFPDDVGVSSGEDASQAAQSPKPSPQANTGSSSAEQNKEQGYDRNERQELDQLIVTTSED